MWWIFQPLKHLQSSTTDPSSNPTNLRSILLREDPDSRQWTSKILASTQCGASVNKYPPAHHAGWMIELWSLCNSMNHNWRIVSFPLTFMPRNLPFMPRNVPLVADSARVMVTRLTLLGLPRNPLSRRISQEGHILWYIIIPVHGVRHYCNLWHRVNCDGLWAPC